MVAQFLLGCGGSPLFTLGTTYIDNHVKVGGSGVDSDLTLAFAPTSGGKLSHWDIQFGSLCAFFKFRRVLGISNIGAKCDFEIWGFKGFLSLGNKNSL